MHVLKTKVSSFIFQVLIERQICVIHQTIKHGKFILNHNVERSEYERKMCPEYASKATLFYKSKFCRFAPWDTAKNICIDMMSLSFMY